MRIGNQAINMILSTEKDNNIKITLNKQLESLHQECLIVELPTMDDLASHCHERVTNTKRKQEV